MKHHTPSILAALLLILLTLLAAPPSQAGPMQDHFDAVAQPLDPVEVFPPQIPALLRSALTSDRYDDQLATLNDIRRFHITELAPDVTPFLASPDPLLRATALQALAATATATATDPTDPAAARPHLLNIIQFSPINDPLTTHSILTADQLLAANPTSPTTSAASNASNASNTDASTNQAIQIWLARLTNTNAPTTLRISAAQSLAASLPTNNSPANQQTRTTLHTLLTDPANALTLRLAAADASAALNTPDSEPALIAAAQTLITAHPLLAARALTTAATPGSHQPLTQLAASSNSAAQSIAITRLAATSPATINTVAAPLLNSTDPQLRAAAAAALARTTIPQPAIQPLLDSLTDPNPLVRDSARNALTQLAFNDPTTRDSIAQTALTHLTNTTNVTLTQQSTLLLGQINHQPAIQPITALLKHTHHLPRAAAAIALRQLNATQSAPQLTQALDAAYNATVQAYRDIQTRTVAPGPEAANASYAIYTEIRTNESIVATELAQTIGLFHYKPAQPTLLLFLPKNLTDSGPALNTPLTIARAAAIWALGQLYANEGSAPFEELIAQRANDLDRLQPEQPGTRRAAAIALGIIKSRNQLGSLRQVLNTEDQGPLMHAAARWAIQNTTGQDPGLAQPEILVNSTLLVPAR